MTWTVVDLETGIASHLGRKASPFHPEHDIVLAGYATKESPEPTSFRFTERDIDGAGKTVAATLEGNKFLVGQNVKFDLLHLLHSPTFRRAWMEFVAGGGLVWDLQLAEYVMDGQDQSSHMLSLDELALRYDEDLKVDEVKTLWEAGIETREIDPALLNRYLIGETLPNGLRREGDIGVTRNIFLKQLARASKLGMGRLMMVEMGALVSSVEMEFNGIYADKELGLQIAAELRAELVEAQKELAKYIPDELPFEFNWTNRYHLSPLIFGGKVKYERRSYELKDGTRTWLEPGQWVTDTLNLSLEDYAFTQKDELHYIGHDGNVYPVEHVACRGGPSAWNLVQNKSGKNAGEYKTKKVKVDDYDKPKSRMVDDHWEFPGYTKPAKEWESATPGLYSVSSDVLDELLENTTVPFLKAMQKVRKLEKDLNTYFINEDGTKGMLTLVGADGIIHHSINHTSTVTGRLSGSKPNMQNIPRGSNSRAKTMLKSRFPGGKIIGSDFRSLEIYCQAWHTEDPNLISDLQHNLDMHCVSLAEAEGMPYDEVYALCKGDRYSAEWDEKRTGAKIVSFQEAYGAGADTIARQTGLPIEQVQKFLAAKRSRYPYISEYFERRAEERLDNAVPTSSFFQHSKNPAVKVQVKISRVATRDGKLYTFRSHESPEYLLKRGITSTFSPTELKNYEVQGLGGQVMKVAMWIAARMLAKEKNFGGNVLLINTVHDAMYLDVNEGYEDIGVALLHACMEMASDFFKYWFKWDIPLPVPSETSIGDDTNVADVVTPNPELLAKFRNAIRATCMDNTPTTYWPIKDKVQ